MPGLGLFGLGASAKDARIAADIAEAAIETITDAEAIGRLISLALRSGIPIREVHRQLRGIASDKAIGLGPNKVLSVPDAIGIALEKWMREKQGVQQDLLGAPPSAPSPVEVVAPKPLPAADSSDANQTQFGFDALNRSESFIGTCPDCGSSLEFAEGCAKCHVCGFSECG